MEIPVARSFDKSRVLDVTPLRSLSPIIVFSQGNPSFSCSSPSGLFPPGATPFYPFAVPLDSQKQAEQSPQTPIAVPNQTGHYVINNSVSVAAPINSFREPPPPPTRSTNGDLIRRSTLRNHTLDGQSQTYINAGEGNVFSDSQNMSAEYLNSLAANINDAEGMSNTGANRSRRKLKTTRSGHAINSSSSHGSEVDSIVDRILLKFNLMALNTRRQDGDRESVIFISTVYNFLRRRITQIEEGTKGVTRRPDLRAGTLLLYKGVRTNNKRRIGAVPGVEVGDIFYFRMEMCLLGLHAPSMGGIDYMGKEEPLAVSIVSSGGYEDDAEDGNVLLYSGHGGNICRRNKHIMDQKLERGNLALEKSLHRANEVRVIRGVKDLAYPSGRIIYLYDGLYRIQESWIEKGKEGYNIFKYKLLRNPGQPEAFVIWKSIQQWKNDINSRVGTILPDLTSGAESLPVSLVNDIDDEKGPTHFTYFPTIKTIDSSKPSFGIPIDSLKPSSGCSCQGGCLPNSLTCSCIKKNEGGYLPYTVNGVLVEKKSVLHECGSCCPCPPHCKNRMSQAGLKVRLEVFKTNDKGWGLRSWDPIRAGSFICEYAGEFVDIKSNMSGIGKEKGDDYIFDSTHIYHQSEMVSDNSNYKSPFPVIISAKNVGNVARFMNHSCFPNLLWQPVFHGGSSNSDLHIAFFAINHVPPMTELTYDYGIIESNDGVQKKKTCLCGSLKCRGYFS